MESISNEQIVSFWNAKPYPHLVIDNFWEADEFEKLSNSNINFFPERTFNTSIENNKQVFSAEDLPPKLKFTVDLLGSEWFVDNYLYPLTNILPINPLLNFPNTIYRFHHQMGRGGILGNHVDHSFLDQSPGQIHILNAIYYHHQRWDKSWGGYTTLNNKPIVEPKPNRLLIFLHTSKSFHGVGRLICPENLKRKTIYMDYYCRVTDLWRLNQQSYKYNYTTNAWLEFWKHHTTFVPGWSWDSYKYWKNWIKYLLREPLIRG